MSTTGDELDRCIGDGPQSVLEMQFLEEYLREKGYSLEDLHLLPEELALRLRKEACLYASLKLAEMEARGHFVREIHG